jgi:anti-sigma28 factor (negative regulator of flagellin synthesis)
MSDITPLGRTNHSAYLNGTQKAVRHVNGTHHPAVRGSDTVEISRGAQLLAKLNSLPDVRQDLVDRVRAQIADGTFDTPERLDAALNAMIADIDE